MAKNKAQRNNGWFVSRIDFIESSGFDSTIYVHENGDWRIANTGEPVKVKDLPAPPAEMWPVRLVSR